MSKILRRIQEEVKCYAWASTHFNNQKFLDEKKQEILRYIEFFISIRPSEKETVMEMVKDVIPEIGF